MVGPQTLVEAWKAVLASAPDCDPRTFRSRESSLVGAGDGLKDFEAGLNLGTPIRVPADSKYRPKKEYVEERLKLEGFRGSLSLTIKAGDPCPESGCKGKLWPTGYHKIEEADTRHGKKMGQSTDFQCDTCHKVIGEADVY